MIIEKNKVVSVDYELTVEDNGEDTLVEKTTVQEPFVFLFGTGDLLEEFEKNLSGLKVGEKFDFVIPSDKGYGERIPENMVDLSIEAFRDEDGEIDEEVLVIGTMLPMTDSDGNRLQGIVAAVTEDTVTMDFNHPLAEKALHFSGKVLNIREATADELNHGHAHGPDGHHHH